MAFFLKNNGSYMTVINFFVYLCKELAMPVSFVNVMFNNLS